ncbi:hypothetical protein B0J14DRAFT_647087 [Halenospora varia]|nr:hypothetical protein B0J14DRAFT_647087 [Halenospora varia]
MDADICSSDIEYELPANPYANVGKRSIGKMLENSRRDHFEPKKKAKTLTNCKRSPEEKRTVPAQVRSPSFSLLLFRYRIFPNPIHTMPSKSSF